MAQFFLRRLIVYLGVLVFAALVAGFMLWAAYDVNPIYFHNRYR